MHEIIVFIEERLERISSSEKLSEYLIGMAESEVGSAESLEASELRSSSASSLWHILAISVIMRPLVFVREHLICLADLLENLFCLYLHRLILMFILTTA